ncbi:MAG: transcription antitermination factor NusB [Candidatus Omnitrophica bacterium]|nr:transcription antitermination factor NusB [Candidatus Omnitrophota bacterium]
MRKRTQARECALKILYQLDMVVDQPLDEVLASYWEFNPNSDDVREFAQQLVRGTREHLDEIDQKIIQYTENWQLNRMAVVDRNILRFAVYELLFMDEIPPKVTINEAVNVAKKYSQDEAGKFVNGILDKINHTEIKKSDTAGSSHELES